MIHTLKCPSCGAPLNYDDDNEGHSIRCPFCNTTAVLPERTGGGARTHVISLSVGDAARHASSVGKYVALVVVVVVLFMSGLIFFIVRSVTNTANNSAETTNRTVEEARRRVMQTVTTATKTPDATNNDPYSLGFASIVLKFGSEGIGAGSFTDARSIAVDAQGRIYVGDYIGGRIQVFDPEGKFITQWMVDAKMPLRGLAADRNGTVYAVQSGKIRRYEGASGKPLGELSYAEGNGFDDVVVTADGGLVAAWGRHKDDIVRFDSSGRVAKVIRAAISGQSERSELNMRLAVDGLGNIYALGTFNDAVFKFTPDGRFVTRFGGDGDQPGQFRAPHALAVDNQGRVYVSDIKGVQVFDTNGRYIDFFKPASVAFGLVFSDKNELFVAARTQVVKLTLTKP